MKKKKLKNLSLNKMKISKVQDLDQIKGGDTLASCVVGTIAIGTRLISLALGTCDCDSVLVDVVVLLLLPAC